MSRYLTVLQLVGEKSIIETNKIKLIEKVCVSVFVFQRERERERERERDRQTERENCV